MPTMLMPTILVLPWRRTDEPRPENAVLFASRFDSTGLRQGWRLFTGGIWLRRAVLRAPGALGVSLRAHPFSGRYYTMSLWRDRESLLAFAHDPVHTSAVAKMAELGPGRGVLASRDADPRKRPIWRDTVRWLAAGDHAQSRVIGAPRPQGHPGHQRRRADVREQPAHQPSESGAATKRSG